MKTNMSLWSIAALCVAAWTLGSSAQAAIISTSYTGQVSGYTFGPGPLATEIPIGTAVSWTLSLDDAFLAVPASGSVFGTATQSTAGTLQVGSRSYVLDLANLSSYNYDFGTDTVQTYRFQVTGSGPAIGGGDFFGLWATFDRNLAVVASSVGYGFTTNFDNGFSVTSYYYADTTGTSVRGTATVPEPGTLGLLGAAIVALGVVRRRTTASTHPA